jgi:putative serine protease PepD
MKPREAFVRLLVILVAWLFAVWPAAGCSLGLTPSTTEPIPNDPRVKAVVEALQPSVVGVRATSNAGAFVQEIGLGTGVILSADGLIVTNEHVITLGGETGDRPASRIDVVLPDGATKRATVVARSTSRDLAFLDVNATGLSPATLAKTLNNVHKGDFVVAIGKGPTLTRPVTAGQVLAILRNVETPSVPGVSTLISSSAPLAQGNSGGPLANEEGIVIGINVAATIEPGDSTDSGSALSIPAPVVLDTMKQVLGERPSPRPDLAAFTRVLCSLAYY